MRQDQLNASRSERQQNQQYEKPAYQPHAEYSPRWRHFYYGVYVEGLRSGTLNKEAFVHYLMTIGFSFEEAELDYDELTTDYSHR